MVYLGDISYSLYLWHWPLIVFSRAIWPGISIAPPIAAALSFAPAILSTRFVESRFLNGLESKQVTKKPLVGIVIISFLPLLTSGIAVRIAESGLGIDGIEHESDHYASLLGNDCAGYPTEFEKKCSSGEYGSSFVALLYGDSQAQAASTGLKDAISELGGQLIVAAAGGCPLLLIKINGQCDSFNNARFSKIKEISPDFVVVVNHQTAYRDENLSGGRVASWSASSNQIEGLAMTLEFFDKLRIPVIVQGEIPVCDFKVNFLSRVLNRNSCMRNLDAQTLHLEFINASQKLVSRFEHHAFIDPTDVICPNSRCAPFLKGKMVFVDVSHLSPSGSRLLTPQYSEAIKKVLEQKKN
jgi:hypothetical protein